MDICITPGKLSGTISAPPSKAVVHRAVICAALSRGKCLISGVEETNDMAATITAARALGADISLNGDTLTVTGLMNGNSKIPLFANINCGESGSTYRFFVPVAAALGVTTSFYGGGRLPDRPITPLTDALIKHGIRVEKTGDEMLTVSGKLTGGRFELPGNVSSQYVTGLLFALPLLDEDSEIVLTSPLESKGYVDITLAALRMAGIDIEVKDNIYSIKGKQVYCSTDSRVEGDYSSVAFWLCAGAVNSDITVTGLSATSLQGDREIISVLQSFGANVAIDQNNGAVRVYPGDLAAIELDVSDIPDLVPVLAAVAAYAKGTTVLYNAGRLRVKESDRLAAVTAGLRALGAEVAEFEDRLEVTGKKKLSGGITDSFNDHRIAMAMSIAALGCEAKTVISGAECVNKSYPRFYDDFKALGGICDVVGMG